MSTDTTPRYITLDTGRGGDDPPRSESTTVGPDGKIGV